MMAVYPNLRQRMVEHGISSKELAAVAGISRMTFHLKMRGIMQWKLPEVVKICCFFQFPDAECLFVRNYYKQQFLESQGKNNNV